MEEGAAERCKEAIEKALHYDQKSPDALQLMASYLFSIEKPEVRRHLYTRNRPVFFVVSSHTAHKNIYFIHSAGSFRSKLNPSAAVLALCAFVSSERFAGFIIMILLSRNLEEEF